MEESDSPSQLQLQPQPLAQDPAQNIYQSHECESRPLKVLVNKPNLLISYLRREGERMPSPNDSEQYIADSSVLEEREGHLGKRDPQGSSDVQSIPSQGITEEEYRRAVDELQAMKDR